MCVSSLMSHTGTYVGWLSSTPSTYEVEGSDGPSRSRCARRREWIHDADGGAESGPARHGLVGRLDQPLLQLGKLLLALALVDQRLCVFGLGLVLRHLQLPLELLGLGRRCPQVLFRRPIPTARSGPRSRGMSAAAAPGPPHTRVLEAQAQGEGGTVRFSGLLGLGGLASPRPRHLRVCVNVRAPHPLRVRTSRCCAVSRSLVIVRYFCSMACADATAS
jgi:hypothetical protein